MLGFALLEVMDKEATVPGMWLGAVVVGGAGLLAGRYSRWVVPAFAAYLLVGAWASWGQLHDPSVGPDIMREAGANYGWHIQASTALGLALCVAGLVWGALRPPGRLVSATVAADEP